MRDDFAVVLSWSLFRQSKVHLQRLRQRQYFTMNNVQLIWVQLCEEGCVTICVLERGLGSLYVAATPT